MMNVFGQYGVLLLVPMNLHMERYVPARDLACCTHPRSGACWCWCCWLRWPCGCDAVHGR